MTQSRFSNSSYNTHETDDEPCLPNAFCVFVKLPCATTLAILKFMEQYSTKNVFMDKVS